MRWLPGISGISFVTVFAAPFRFRFSSRANFSHTHGVASANLDVQIGNCHCVTTPAAANARAGKSADKGAYDLAVAGRACRKTAAIDRKILGAFHCEFARKGRRAHALTERARSHSMNT